MSFSEAAKAAGATHRLWREDSPIQYYLDGLTEISMVVMGKHIVAKRGRRWSREIASQYNWEELT
jgi:hypothetical protein